MTLILTPSVENQMRIRLEKDRVLIIAAGRLLFDMSWQEALVVARAIMRKARLAEEYAKAEQIIMDNAMLLRGGVPIGLSDNRHIQKETAKEAAWNSDLRRYMPGGVRSQEQVGAPAVHDLEKWRRRQREKLEGVGR